jgi:hypothetical protein
MLSSFLKAMIPVKMSASQKKCVKYRYTSHMHPLKPRTLHRPNFQEHLHVKRRTFRNLSTRPAKQLSSPLTDLGLVIKDQVQVNVKQFTRLCPQSELLSGVKIQI